MSKESAKFAATMTMKESTERFLVAREACIMGGVIASGLTREESENVTDEAIEVLYENLKPEIKSQTEKIDDLFQGLGQKK